MNGYKHTRKMNQEPIFNDFKEELEPVHVVVPVLMAEEDFNCESCKKEIETIESICCRGLVNISDEKYAGIMYEFIENKLVRASYWAPAKNIIKKKKSIMDLRKMAIDKYGNSASNEWETESTIIYFSRKSWEDRLQYTRNKTPFGRIKITA